MQKKAAFPCGRIYGRQQHAAGAPYDHALQEDLKPFACASMETFHGKNERGRTVSSLPAKRGRRVRQPRVVAFHRFVRRGMRPSFAYSSPSLELPKVLYCRATSLLLNLYLPPVNYLASNRTGKE